MVQESKIVTYQHKSNNFVAQKQLKEIKNYSISRKWYLPITNI